MIIKSVQNQIFKDALSLQNKKLRDKNGLFFVEGKKQIYEIPKNRTIKQIFISEKYKNDVTNFKNVIMLSNHLFSKLSATKSPQGIMAIVEKKYYAVEDIIKNSGLFILLENIQDPGNLGTIIRSADAFGAKAVFVSKGSADIYSDKTIRATMGSIFHLPIIDSINIKNTLNLMKNKKISVFAASLKGEKYLNDIKFPNKSAFVIGNEANGLRSETENSADTLVKIYMPGNTESLNAATAASIIMYEAAKSRTFIF
ncbi:RNA methyltransferase [Endomicrobiia bacterium]|uniref:TrmH family RNA methyltransferase n=1 Tax=Endomicrobium trichonymphae TaxID=1408204 RepID=UPI000866141E|nr:RNA methyltransferase [Candidatus Endomicrobium trichonymphae]GHT06381.1 RNA methyltransferase [Endomicrobiia bacterium]BAV58827.1 23S rRNA (guanosine-2'-O-)-methyltransferase [Candidatus Endomicrobium trichonymphae]GHT08849.1 RNA methyltransferase [Endomicrobiia bacterium]GHT12494.1 RNA methyltransferase [Endomicrobiia bacterium]GHT16773.1 RNA methyltransferase [Endomicrobiia bacterium]